MYPRKWSWPKGEKVALSVGLAFEDFENASQYKTDVPFGKKNHFSLSFGDFVAPALVGGADAVMISNIVINLLGVAFDWPMAAAIGIVVITFGLTLISISGRIEQRGAVRT